MKVHNICLVSLSVSLSFYFFFKKEQNQRKITKQWVLFVPRQGLLTQLKIFVKSIQVQIVTGNYPRVINVKIKLQHSSQKCSGPKPSQNPSFFSFSDSCMPIGSTTKISSFRPFLTTRSTLNHFQSSTQLFAGLDVKRLENKK